MVCPVCITSALIASAPSLAAGIGGIAAVKLAVNRAIGRRECASTKINEKETVKSIRIFKASSGVQASLREERAGRLRPEPVRVEVQEQWWKPVGHQKWDDM